MTGKYADTHKCKDCKFYVELYAWEGDSKGNCHRFAPYLITDIELQNWPIISGNDFCGEFQTEEVEITNDYKWHSITEEKPKTNGFYLIYHWYQDCVERAFWNGNEFKFPGDYTIRLWTNLPEKPSYTTVVVTNLTTKEYKKLISD